MTIIGIGVDLVEVERITAAVTRHGPTFLQRIFTPQEIAACGVRHERLAARFAAKEAVAKAFGTGIGAAMGFQDIEVVNEPSGRPTVVLHGTAAATSTARGVAEIHLSLSHTTSHAIAHVVITGG